MQSPHPVTITTTWLVLNLLPLLIAVVTWLVLGSWFWSLLLVMLYPIYVVPYGFFVSLPLMVRLFRQPASLHRP